MHPRLRPLAWGVVRSTGLDARTLLLLRLAWHGYKARALATCVPSLRRRRAGWRTARRLSVNLGSGGQGRPDWVNLDVHWHRADGGYPWDLRRPLPFADGQVARLFAEHVVEHLDFRDDVPRLFGECLRVLEPGGRLRVVVPDGRRWLEAYVADTPEAWRDLGQAALPPDMPTRMALVNHVFHQGGEHRFAYDFETLAWAIRRTGFSDVRQMRFGVSADPELALDQPHHAPYSLYAEATK
jgi:predicted SAM-dependent methyltransferase